MNQQLIIFQKRVTGTFCFPLHINSNKEWGSRENWKCVMILSFFIWWKSQVKGNIISLEYEPKFLLQWTHTVVPYAFNFVYAFYLSKDFHISCLILSSWLDVRELRKVHSCVLCCFSHVWLFATPWTAACLAPLSILFSRQEYWSGLPCPPPGKSF